jgi:hypothetical protein
MRSEPAGLPPHPHPHPLSLPLWPLAAVAGLLPLVASLLAFALSVQAQTIPACNPFVEGCVSISRAAREGLANHLFRALMLPAATLQALVWLLAARWLHAALPASRGVALLPWLGVAAGVALVLYGSFLGTEGEAYRFLRRWGTVVYFGATALCLMLTGRAVQQAQHAGVLSMPRTLRAVPTALAVALALLGVGNSIVAVAFGGEAKARVENVTEWWGGLAFVAGLLALAAMWRHAGLRVSLSGRPSPP